MRNHPTNVLPKRVEAGLAELGLALKIGQIPTKLLDTVVDGLRSLPAGTVARADVEIARSAGLDRWGVVYRGLIRPPIPAADLLEREPGLAPLFLFHRDGHVREAALDLLLTPPASPFFLAALAWRLNDWVAQVRNAAARSAERLFPAVASDVVLGAAPFLLDRWRHWGRWEGQRAAILDGLFNREDVSAGLAKRFATGTTGPLAMELRYGLRSATLDPYLLRLARDAMQPAVRAVALQALISGFTRWPVGFRREWIDKRYGSSRRVTSFAQRELAVRFPADSLIVSGLQDRSAIVRRVAADALIERRVNFPMLGEVMAALLGDRSRSVRERGEFLARKQAERSHTDPRTGAAG